ncbi:alpha/beta hydrolase [Sandaracinobacter neustonicus]|uniref:Alpha/beta hydrolase n=1 Tax=Sandaracinobacter neustonicus TaxID=1715348 RepID=A0A501XK86_9SPHN|nr:alpha/beta hydrolase [Sandaracinobacter neustonicus]TPE61098.1 alpha/beta hydrolase [Sandaracinobacter neustonicus]
MSIVLGVLKTIFVGALLLLAAVFLVRMVQSMRGPDLQPWHLVVPPEPTASEIDAMDWPTWLKAEDAAFKVVQSEVVAKLPADQRIAQNRYWAESPMNSAHLRTDWNRSFTFRPEGEPAGAVVLLHGLTDGPYSLRHVAKLYEARGWAVVAIRNPGHGTVPAGLTKAGADQWQAATRLAVREATRLAPGKPLHIVGYSNGAALAMMYALDATENPKLAAPQKVVLISPMIGLTRFARFAGLAAMPSIFPAFVKAAWLGIEPEYNPFKYNSFPVRAGAESHRMTVILGEKIEAARASGRMGRLPPILTFQSVVDSTVSAPAVVEGLYSHLPANGSELVLFDINRAAYVGPMVRHSAQTAIDRLRPAGPHRYTLTLVMNAAPGDPQTVARSYAPDATTPQDYPLGIAYRRDFYSLGHVALPFPLSDGLYGADPSPDDRQGVALGALAARGENGVLGIPPSALARVSSNPFMPWMLGRMDPAAPPAQTPEQAAAQ